MARVQKRTLIGLAGLLLLEVAFAGAAARGSETVLYAFQGGTDGSLPAAGVIADDAGNLFGTTYFGGGGGCAPGGCGTIFELAPNGAETVLYAFKGDNDGELPQGGLVAGKAGNYYGTTTQGGASASGTAFKLAPGGTEKVLHAFSGDRDGYYPAGDLAADNKGNFYGTTEFGGRMNAAECNYDGCGVVFEIGPGGRMTGLHVFRGGRDGIEPMAGVISDGKGNLFGTTYFGGGGDNCATGCGTVFTITPQGRETVLYVFRGGSDGSLPVGGLTMDGSGNLYGTTSYGGPGGANCPEGTLGCGTVFRIAPDGTETVLYAFQGGSDGWSPYAGVIADQQGNLYGTTYFGGGTGCGHNAGCGTVFKLAPDGKERVLYAFQGGSDGGLPEAALLAGKNGILIGTATVGGTKDNGVVFSVSK